VETGTLIPEMQFCQSLLELHWGLCHHHKTNFPNLQTDQGKAMCAFFSHRGYNLNDLSQPRSVNHMFGNWLNNQHKDFKQLIWVGVAAVFWAIWKCRNYIVFKKMKFNSILQVIFRGAYWLRVWAQLQRKEQAKDIHIAMSRRLEVIALQFANEGWNNFYRLP
jgi:hypothetical protein